MDYLSYSKALPDTPTPDFLAFIDSNEPLSKKLREKWLYTLAKEKSWTMYHAHYQPSKDISLQCYDVFARYTLGENVTASAKTIWLTGKSLPDACTPLFKALIEKNIITNTLILERVALTLEKRNIALAKYLVTQAHLSSPSEKRTLELIQRQPLRIASLSPSKLHSNYYLYGLKKLVASNPKRAISVFETAKTQNMLNDTQKQDFLAHLALYQAIRNKPDASNWFKQLNPESYTESLLAWQIRFAIRNHDWAQVKALIEHSSEQDEMAWQYWLARAEIALGNKAVGQAIYQNLATKRHYYGFLASTQLHQALSFEAEPESDMDALLAAYEPVMSRIESLYHNHRRLEASRMANDFASELPKVNKSAFIAWLHQKLHWTGKSVYLSGDEALQHQLSLRFPLAHHQSVTQHAANYHLPKALIYAVIRQESAFRQDVISPVGAHGLMQLMPKTAKHVARQTGIRYTNRHALFIPDKNIQLGTAYLKQLATRFNHNPILMIAAYNAGPHQVNRWIKQHPIEADAIDIWIETLPFGETRHYLKSVIAFYAVYQYRLEEAPSLNVFMQQNLKLHRPAHKGSFSANQSAYQAH